ncbi:MAG: hypothetical protein AAFX05_00915 [Planctomycetota bacterium]
MKMSVSAVLTAAGIVAIAGTASATFDSILNLGYDSSSNQASTTSATGFFQDAGIAAGLATDGVITAAAANGVWNNEFVTQNGDNFAMSTFIAVDNRHQSEWLFNDTSFLPGGPQVASGVWSLVSTGAFASGDTTIGGPGVGTAIAFGSVGAEHPTAPIAVTDGTFNGIFAGRFVIEAGALIRGAVGATITTTGGAATESFQFPANGRSGFGPATTVGGEPIGAYFELSAGAGPNGQDVIDLYILDGVPTPGTAAVLGLAGLAGMRRRR